MKKNIRTALLIFLTIGFFTGMPVLSFAESVVWSDTFVQYQPPGNEQCQAWHDFLDQLNPNIEFVSVTMSGTFDPEGITMSDPIAVQELVYLLYTRTPGNVTSDGHTWYVGIGCNSTSSCVPGGEGVALRIDKDTNCDCSPPGYTVRPDIGNRNWGGINTPSCRPESQTMMVEFITSSDDADNDGIVDDEDMCPSSDFSPSIVINGCDSGVGNFLFSEGCSVNDYVAECAANATNHGLFVSCISDILNRLKQDGLISGKEKGTVQKCAAKSDLP